MNIPMNWFRWNKVNWKWLVDYKIELVKFMNDDVKFDKLNLKIMNF